MTVLLVLPMPTSIRRLSLQHLQIVPRWNLRLEEDRKNLLKIPNLLRLRPHLVPLENHSKHFFRNV